VISCFPGAARELFYAIERIGPRVAMGLFSRKKGAQGPAEPAPRKSTVLIVDDDITIADLNQAVFEGRAWRVVTAYDGLGALRSLNEEKPDLVLLDLMLPDVPGERVLESITKARLPSKVIVVTGRFVTYKDFEAYRGTVLTVLRKPYEMKTLQRLIDSFEAGTEIPTNMSSVGDV